MRSSPVCAVLPLFIVHWVTSYEGREPAACLHIYIYICSSSCSGDPRWSAQSMLYSTRTFACSHIHSSTDRTRNGIGIEIVIEKARRDATRQQIQISGKEGGGGDGGQATEKVYTDR